MPLRTEIFGESGDYAVAGFVVTVFHFGGGVEVEGEAAVDGVLVGGMMGRDVDLVGSWRGGWVCRHFWCSRDLVWKGVLCGGGA